jgi:hypothetical protein
MAERTAQRLTKPEEYAELLDRFDTFLFDCDGVIWTGPTLVPGMTDVLTMLRSKGTRNRLYFAFFAEMSYLRGPLYCRQEYLIRHQQCQEEP